MFGRGVCVTDIHTDHLDPRALAELTTPKTTVIVPTAARPRLLDLVTATTMANGEKRTVGGVAIEAVPMYNLGPDAASGMTWHPKGRGNGYVVTLGGQRIYVAGDTACTSEVRALKGIDVAFLPMNVPFTMSPAEAADCAKAFRPAIVYPYHHFESDVQAFESALRGTRTEGRLRDWYRSR